VIAVDEVRPDFSQVGRSDGLIARHTQRSRARRSPIHQNESHVAPPNAKQDTEADGWEVAAYEAKFSDRGRRRAVTYNRLFRLAVRLRGLRLMAQSYVGKHAISKRDRTSYTEVWGVFGVNTLLRRSREYPRISMDGGDRRQLHAERHFTAGAMICFRVRSQAEIGFDQQGTKSLHKQNRSLTPAGAVQ
jgi:hypothetical protein